MSTLLQFVYPRLLTCVQPCAADKPARFPPSVMEKVHRYDLVVDLVASACAASDGSFLS